MGGCDDCVPPSVFTGGCDDCVPPSVFTGGCDDCVPPSVFTGGCGDCVPRSVFRGRCDGCVPHSVFTGGCGGTAPRREQMSLTRTLVVQAENVAMSARGWSIIWPRGEFARLVLLAVAARLLLVPLTHTWDGQTW